jgi:hypothetical protein
LEDCPESVGGWFDFRVDAEFGNSEPLLGKSVNPVCDDEVEHSPGTPDVVEMGI